MLAGHALHATTGGSAAKAACRPATTSVSRQRSPSADVRRSPATAPTSLSPDSARIDTTDAIRTSMLRGARGAALSARGADGRRTRRGAPARGQ
jgi:hypothetical protein